MFNDNWCENIPKHGVLCKCKVSKHDSEYVYDVIVRYNAHPLSDYKFKPLGRRILGYEVAIPVSRYEVEKLIY